MIVPLLFGLAAAAGGLIRWQMHRLDTQSVPIGTLSVNLVAAFAAAIATDVSPTVGVVAVTAFLGSTSTFSTLVGELTDRWQDGRRLAAVAYGGLTVVGGIGSALVGLAVAG